MLSSEQMNQLRLFSDSTPTAVKVHLTIYKRHMSVVYYAILGPTQTAICSQMVHFSWRESNRVLIATDLASAWGQHLHLKLMSWMSYE